MADHIDGALRSAVEEELLERLSNGESLIQICNLKGMPSRRTVQRWQDADADFDVAITRAREAGMFVIAEQAVQEALIADDASKGRLAFDARRWYVGKLSNAFSDNKEQKHKVTMAMEPETAEWLGLTS